MTQDPNEFSKVEQPFFEQLQMMGWEYLKGDVDIPDFTDRASFGDTLLVSRLKNTLKKLNPWIGDQQLTQVLYEISHLAGTRLLERNQAAMELLVRGIPVDVDQAEHGIKTKTVRLFDFETAVENDFLVVNQFRVDIPGNRSYCVPDLVLFVNGIPLVVVECKNPSASNPVEAAIGDLLKYSNQRDTDEEEGVERLFDFNLFMVATTFYEARGGTIGARHKHFLEWKDTSPVPSSEFAEQLDVTKLSSQQMLIAGMLHPERLLDLLHNFVLFMDVEGRTVKIIARYQQYRAVMESIHRLETKPTRSEHGDTDQRGGVIWHTQGSGKSLTMVFLVRKMRATSGLQQFKIVIVTDRKDLQRQLSETAQLTGEPVRVAQEMKQLPVMLAEKGQDLVFAMIQKYQNFDDPPEDEEFDEDDERFKAINDDASILVMVDEAQRSHGSSLHGKLMRALPECAKIGFTGTPIIANPLDEKKKGKKTTVRPTTESIFGGFIDIYTMKQSQIDRATVPIMYEGWGADCELLNDQTIDELFEETYRDLSEEDREAIKDKYVKQTTVREAREMIREHARHILRDYVSNGLPEGFKAQVVAISRRAAVRYQEYLAEAHMELLEEVSILDPELLELSDEELADEDEETRFLVDAAKHLDVLERLEFAAIISGSKEDTKALKKWTSGKDQEDRIRRFKKPLSHDDESRQDGLCMLCVKSMLLTGFDAPVNQTLYLDRFMQGHELLQAIARVNRNYDGKYVGRVVDYFGVSWHLGEALRIYTVDDRKQIAKGLTSIRDELNRLDDRHLRCLMIFRKADIDDISDVDACVDLLRDEKLRAEFVMELKGFLSILNVLRFRPEASKYIPDARQLGFINKAAANLYRDDQLTIADCGEQVRQMIDEHLVSRGMDPKVAPVEILDPQFENHIEDHQSDRTKAAAMEHAARYHLTTHADEDPVLYRALSERLRNILRDFADKWTEQLEALREFIEHIRDTEQQDVAGLAPQTQVPFLRLLMDRAEEQSDESEAEQLKRFAGITVELVDHIRQEVRRVDFWRNPPAQETLRSQIEVFLDDNDALDFDQCAPAADDILQLARKLHARLVQ